MKNYFHILFVGAVLLGSLIIFNKQNDERSSQLADKYELVQTELLAEISSSQTDATTLPAYMHKPEIAFESIAGNLKHLGFLKSAEHQVRSKTQLQIHLELLPVFGIQSGQFLPHFTGPDDPPHLLS